MSIEACGGECYEVDVTWYRRIRKLFGRILSLVVLASHYMFGNHTKEVQSLSQCEAASSPPFFAPGWLSMFGFEVRHPTSGICGAQASTSTVRGHPVRRVIARGWKQEA